MYVFCNIQIVWRQHMLASTISTFRKTARTSHIRGHAVKGLLQYTIQKCIFLTINDKYFGLGVTSISDTAFR